MIAARELSRGVAKELGVKHESPQAIWLDLSGSVRWHESHGGITADALEETRRAI